MKPTSFKEQNIVFAEEQDEYLPLPAWHSEDGEVISCWQLTIKDRVMVLFSGKVWLRQLTFLKRLQPQLVEAQHPFRPPPIKGIVGMWRLFWNLCPNCKSDASLVDTCAVCEAYSGPYPPSPLTKRAWETHWIYAGRPINMSFK